MHELTTVPEGVAKVRIERDAKVRNAASFILAVEDHTIGNLLRMQCVFFAFDSAPIGVDGSRGRAFAGE